MQIYRWNPSRGTVDIDDDTMTIRWKGAAFVVIDGEGVHYAIEEDGVARPGAFDMNTDTASAVREIAAAVAKLKTA